MDEFSKKFLSEVDAPEPSAGLHAKIMRRIERVEHRSLAIKAFGFGTLCALSLTLVGFGVVTVVSQISQSGLFQILSLFVSDFSVAIANFQDVMFSIVESLPALSLGFLLVGVTAVIWSAAHFIDDIAQIRTLKLS